MNEDQTQHVLDEIETYLADGLSPAERELFQSHVASCPACAAALVEARDADLRLQTLFKQARPAPGFEDKMIQTLRVSRGPRARLFHPLALRSAAAIAATVVLAGTGVAVSSVMDGNSALSSLMPEGPEKVSSNLRQMGRAVETGGEVYRRSQAASTPSAAPSARGAATGRLEALAETDQKTEAHYFQSQGRSARDKDSDRIADLTKSTALSTDNNYAFRPAEALGVSKQPEHAEVTDAEGKPVQRQPGIGGGFGGGRSESEVLKYSVALGDAAAAKPPAPQAWGLSAGTTSATPGLIAQQTEQAPPPAAPPAGAPPVEAPPAAAPNPPANLGRKVIRNGTMEFEVQSFDDALIRVTKLVVEEGGFVATTDSDKLPNGKMRGTVTLRVPPEHLDTLALTLRGIGDLKSQKITAEDVTKHYTDLESQLRAAQAMYDRLLAIVKDGKGQIKDLVAAEKELGVWEEKIEQIKGEQRYLDNLIGYSTLTLVLSEKDIKTPASVSETEQVTMSLETEKVEEDYQKAIDAIKEAKGRIVQSELKQYDAGQLGGTIQAAIPPDAAEQVIARLRQLDGRIAHFARDRNQKMQAGEVASAAVPRVTREDLVLSMQIYNLANIAPRRTTTLQLAAAAVDHAYQQVIEQVRSAGGRIVTSSLAKPDPNTQVADLDFQVPSEKADLLLETVRGYGETMRQDATENPDTVNVTEAKRGFHLRIVSLAAVPARETQTIQLAAANVSQAFADLLAAVKGVDGRVFQSDLNEQNTQDVTGSITVEIPRAAFAAVNATMNKSAELLSRAVNRSADVENTVDTKIRLALTLSSGDHLPPRQVTTVREEVSDVERSVDDLVNAATSAGGRRIGSGDISQDRAGHVTAQVVVDVPLASANSVLDALEKMGYRRSKQVAFDGSVPDGPLARARIDATFSNSSASLGGEETTWDAIRHGLATSGRGLRWSVQMIIIGLCFVAPWVLALWVAVRIYRRPRKPAVQPAAV